MSRPKVISLVEAAERTGRHYETVRQWAVARTIPAYRVGRAWVIAERDVKAIEAHPWQGRRRSGNRPPMTDDGEEPAVEPADWDDRRLDDESFIAGQALRFHIMVVPGAVLRSLNHDQPTHVVGKQYAEKVEAAIRPALSGSGIRVRAKRWKGARTGGPTPPQSEVVSLIGVANDAIGAIVNLVGIAVIVRAAIAKAREITGREVLVSDGVAILAAAELIATDLGLTDLTLAFVAPLTRHTPGLEWVDTHEDGYVVGFRDDERLVVVHVDEHGNAQMAAGDIPVRWRPVRE